MKRCIFSIFFILLFSSAIAADCNYTPVSSDILSGSRPYIPPPGKREADSIYYAFSATMDSLSKVLSKKEFRTWKREHRYERRLANYQYSWNKLIPDYSKLQIAGGIGLFSLGFGWDYGRKEQWETDIFFGFLPKYSSDKAKITFTIKQNYIPWRIKLGRWPLSYAPLRCGLYFNTIFSGDFWTREPDRYPKGYYGFSTKIRMHVFLGQDFQFDLPHHARRRHKSIAFYYELSTYDVALVSYFTNSSLDFGDLVSLSFGLKFKVF